MSIRTGPTGERQRAPMPMPTRGLKSSSKASPASTKAAPPQGPPLK